jgi:hypothetical protein
VRPSSDSESLVSESVLGKWIAVEGVGVRGQEVPTGKWIAEGVTVPNDDDEETMVCQPELECSQSLTHIERRTSCFEKPTHPLAKMPQTEKKVGFGGLVSHTSPAMNHREGVMTALATGPVAEGIPAIWA